MISILAILIVFFIGVSNVENAPARKPFPTEGASNANLNTDESANDQQNADKTEDTLTSPATTEKPQIEVAKPALPSTAPSNLYGDLVVKNINSEALMKAGFSSFVIKPKPFNGKLFDRFDLSMLSYLNIVEKEVLENNEGNQRQVLLAVEFELTDKSQNQEVYDYLKAKIKDELGASVNETNQFGLSSFFINFNEPTDQAFLVVKTRTNVYALSYPKAKNGDKNYFDSVSKLLLELI